MYYIFVENIDIDRIFIDLVAEEYQYDFRKYVVDHSKEEGYDYFGKLFSDFLEHNSKLNYNELINLRYDLKDRIIKGYKEDKFDVVITRVSTIIDELNQLGIPNKFVCPTEKYIMDKIDELIQEINLRNIYSDFPGKILIRISSDNNEESELQELRQVYLKKENIFCH